MVRCWERLACSMPSLACRAPAESSPSRRVSTMAMRVGCARAWKTVAWYARSWLGITLGYSISRIFASAHPIPGFARRATGYNRDVESMLIIFGGLPGVGKTAIAAELARLTGALHIRIDSIEQAIRASGVVSQPIDDVGYRVAYTPEE